MSEVTGRLWAVSEATSRHIRQVPELAGGSKVVEVFGSNTFDVSAMKEKLPKPVFKSLQETIRRVAGVRAVTVQAGDRPHRVRLTVETTGAANADALMQAARAAGFQMERLAENRREGGDRPRPEIR